MYETKSELEDLQRLLDRSMGGAGAHVRSIFKDEHRLSALQVSAYLMGVRQVAAATVSSKGEPRVAPVDSVFFHGKFHVSTDMNSLRAKHLQRKPQLSLTYFESADPAIIAHGIAEFIGKDNQDFVRLDAEWVKAYGQSVSELSSTVTFIRLDARRMLAYALHPERFSRISSSS
jgi:hypothetical protein